MHFNTDGYLYIHCNAYFETNTGNKMAIEVCTSWMQLKIVMQRCQKSQLKYYLHRLSGMSQLVACRLCELDALQSTPVFLTHYVCV